VWDSSRPFLWRRVADAAVDVMAAVKLGWNHNWVGLGFGRWLGRQVALVSERAGDSAIRPGVLCGRGVLATEEQGHGCILIFVHLGPLVPRSVSPTIEYAASAL